LNKLRELDRWGGFKQREQGDDQSLHQFSA
jgi:hypothetical protein